MLGLEGERRLHVRTPAFHALSGQVENKVQAYVVEAGPAREGERLSSAVERILRRR